VAAVAQDFGHSPTLQTLKGGESRKHSCGLGLDVHLVTKSVSRQSATSPGPRKAILNK
jgi:hypothetical protein